MGGEGITGVGIWVTSRLEVGANGRYGDRTHFLWKIFRKSGRIPLGRIRLLEWMKSEGKSTL